jgi:enoyl-CoA hydratase
MIELEPSGDGPVRMRLDRPPVNALDLEFVQAITAAIARAIEEGAPAVVLTGQGHCFCAGIDTKLVPTYTDEQRRAAIGAINTMVSALYGAPVPIVAALNGHALGGGLVLALACDLRLASAGEYQLALNEVAAGVPFPAGPLAVVRAELDAPVVRDLCLTGRAVGPPEALALRLVDELAEPAELLESALERARQLASHSAYGIVKRQLRGAVAAELERIAIAGDDPLLSGGPVRESPLG